MYDKEVYGFCSEFYVVEKTIVVVVEMGGETRRVRIDALRHEHGRAGDYSAKAYVEENVTVHLTDPETDASSDRPPEDITLDIKVWVHYDLPWTLSDSADDVLRCALGHLESRCSD